MEHEDDLVLVVRVRNENTLVINTNKCLDRVGAWIREHGLLLAVDKSEVIILQGRRSREHITLPSCWKDLD